MKWNHVVVSFIAVILILVNLPEKSAAEQTTYNILALGDSLASGINEKNQPKDGYADYLAKLLDNDHYLGEFTKQYSCPGYTSETFKSDLKADVKKVTCKYDTQVNPALTINEAIQHADIITISIGANDIISKVKIKKDGTLDYNIFDILIAINDVSNNVEEIIKHVKSQNSDVSIIVMGYYNPFPHLLNAKETLQSLVSNLDASVKLKVETNGATYVQVASLLASKYKTYIPNPENIHLSAAGYKAVAAEMAKVLPVQLSAIPKDVDPFNWGTQAVLDAQKLKIFFGYKDGTFKPNTPLSRSGAASILRRQFKVPSSSIPLPFKDANAVHSSMVEDLRAMAAANLIYGTSDGRFLPSDKIKRKHFAVLLYRAHMKINDETYSKTLPMPYEDIQSVSAETKLALAFLYENGIISSSKKFNPDSDVTRVAAAAMLVRYNAVFSKK